MSKECVLLPREIESSHFGSGNVTREIIITETLQISHVGKELSQLECLKWCYLGDNWQIFNQLSKVLTSFGEEISSGYYINKKARTIRRKYLNYEKIISDAHDQLFWESTDLAEKSLVNNNLFTEICKALVFVDIINKHKGNIVFIVDDLFYGKFLKALGDKIGDSNISCYNSKEIKTQKEIVAESLKVSGVWKKQGLCEIKTLSERLLLQKNYVEEVRRKKDKAELNKKAINTLIVVWGTPSTFCSHKFKTSDTEYGDLPGILKNNSDNIAYLVIPVDWQFSYKFIINNAIDSKDIVYTVQECFDIESAEKLAIKGNCYPIKLKSRLIIDGIDFTQLLKKSYMHEKSKSRQFWALNFYYIARYFYNNNIRISNLLLGYENQPWEKLLRSGFRRWLPDTKICQYIHGAIGSFWMSAFPGYKDIDEGNMPDKLAVFSKKCKEQFLADGFRNDQLTVWPAFKYKRYLDGDESQKQLPNNNDKKENLNVLISLNISKDNSIELLLKTFLLSKELKFIDYRVRFHPRMAEDREIISQLKQLCEWDIIPSNILIKSENSIQEDLNWSDVVLLQGSGVEIEAAIRGCYTILVNSDCNINVNYMDLREHNAVVTTGEEINNVLGNLIKNRYQLVKRPWSQEKCDYYFEPVNKYNINGIYSALNGYSKASAKLG